jgi:Tat protein secretion system quality control protein TatD with DNase activity
VRRERHVRSRGDDDSNSLTGTSALVGRAERIRVALGLHPQLARERRSELDLFDRMLPEARYVGEVGLDGSPELRDQWHDQLAVFEHVLSSCRAAGGRIMSIHSPARGQCGSGAARVLPRRRSACTSLVFGQLQGIGKGRGSRVLV